VFSVKNSSKDGVDKLKKKEKKAGKREREALHTNHDKNLTLGDSRPFQALMKVKKDKKEIGSKGKRNMDGQRQKFTRGRRQ